MSDIKVKYIKLDNNIRLIESASVDINDTLPLSTYNLMLDPETGQFYLNDIGTVGDIPEKVYGHLDRYTDRIMETFKYRSPANTGIMLSGVKGAGKTLLTKLISIRAAEEGLPTVLVNSAYNPDKLAQFIKRLDTRCVIVFDEFDKTYDASIKGDNGEDIGVNVQAPLLSLLDGVYATNKLFVFSLNELASVNDYMLNRPGRVFYHYKFSTLDAETVEDVCNDKLKNKKYTKDIVMLSYIVHRFTFDILNAVIAECNHYDESPLKFIDAMNVHVGLEGYYRFELVDDNTGTVIGSCRQYIGEREYDGSYGNIEIRVDPDLFSDKWFDENAGKMPSYDGGPEKWITDALAVLSGKKLKEAFPDIVPACVCDQNNTLRREGDLGVYVGGNRIGRYEPFMFGCLDERIMVRIPAELSNGDTLWGFVRKVERGGDIVTVPLFGDNVVLRISKERMDAYNAYEFKNAMAEEDWSDLAFDIPHACAPCATGRTRKRRTSRK